jgi:predicted lipid-binding transport protein (Tim44 family)
MNEDQLTERVHAVEVSQATQAATLAGAQATQAAAQAGTVGVMIAGSAGLVAGLLLGILLGRAPRA